MYRLHLHIDRLLTKHINKTLVRATLRAALTHQAAPRSEVTVQITDDATLRQLNREYLGHDYATDVLSFPSEEHDPVTGQRYLGDLALSWQRVEAQARAGGHTPEAELQLLLVHGILHLMGHDHATAAEKQRMWRAQAEILSALGAEITAPLKSKT